MTENTSIARPYAQAIFELARDSGDYAQWSEALASLAIFAADPDMNALFNNPRASREEVAAVLIDLVGERLDGPGKNLVNLLARNRRLYALDAIAVQFEAFRAEAERTVQAELETALPVSAAHRDRIIEALAKRLERQVELSVSTNESLVGGAVIRAGDLVIDGSVRAQLDKLAAAIGT
ncbi:MAG: F0F1 ATP synthase subunit delta [Arenicellales bacterium]|nr:F0F1 ATP synthase subunit delta [Arenicellales bacterium]MDP6948882.1 F0F1 ATP synthase subunit delta [Arenicellales bacterium]